MRRVWVWVGVLFALLAACGETTPRTQVMVVVQAEAEVQTRASALGVDVRGGPSFDALSIRESVSYGDGGDHPLTWPVRIALIPEGGDASRVFDVVATASDDAGAVAQSRIASSYLAGETLVLELWLRDDCIGTLCPGDESCDRGACRLLEPVDPCDLERLDGPSPTCVGEDAGAPADAGDVDAGDGTDAGSDAGVDPDAGTFDAGADSGVDDAGSMDAMPPGDAGPDAGPGPLDLHNVVFVTSTTRAGGDLGGLSGADGICQARARAAGLPRPSSYVAFLSTGATNASMRLAGSRGWVRVDGLPFVDTVTDLAQGRILYPVRLSERGTVPIETRVLTGTAADLTGRAGFCGGWTNRTGTAGARGDAREGPGRWVNIASAVPRCDMPFGIYCFGTGLSRPLDPLRPPAGAAMAFVSSGGLNGRNGVSGFDTLCRNDAMAAGFTGTYRAFVAPSRTRSAISRFSFTGPWYRPDGPLVAATRADVSAERLEAAISVQANGAHVGNDGIWAGAQSPTSTGSLMVCGGWTVPIGGLGLSGVTGSTFDFFLGNSSTCGTRHRVLCLRD